MLVLLTYKNDLAFVLDVAKYCAFFVLEPKEIYVHYKSKSLKK